MLCIMNQSLLGGRQRKCTYNGRDLLHTLYGVYSYSNKRRHEFTNFLIQIVHNASCCSPCCDDPVIGCNKPKHVYIQAEIGKRKLCFLLPLNANRAGLEPRPSMYCILAVYIYYITLCRSGSFFMIRVIVISVNSV